MTSSGHPAFSMAARRMPLAGDGDLVQGGVNLRVSARLSGIFQKPSSETGPELSPAGGSAMMRWITGSSVRLARLVTALALAVVALGVAQLRSTPVDTYPEFMPPMVQVRTEALGLSAAEVEQLVTVPLEQDLLNGVPWLDEIRSESLTG